ncbi:MAG: ornithine cyclodeaminase family protein, partial [Xenophilus sp.]
MQHFDAEATRAALPFDRLIPALRAAFAAGAQVPPRHVHTLPGHGGARGTALIMPAWNESFLGIKTINIFPGNGARGLPGLHATYVLYDAATGVPLALMDGNEITARRTAGAAALGAGFLARQDAR